MSESIPNHLAKPELSGGKPADLSYLADAKQRDKILAVTKHLTDEQFETYINEIGFRAALFELRTQACQGDVKALDLYLKHCGVWREKKRLAQPRTTSEASAAFTPQRKRRRSAQANESDVSSIDASVTPIEPEADEPEL